MYNKKLNFQQTLKLELLILENKQISIYKIIIRELDVFKT